MLTSHKHAQQRMHTEYGSSRKSSQNEKDLIIHKLNELDDEIRQEARNATWL